MNMYSCCILMGWYSFNIFLHYDLIASTMATATMVTEGVPNQKP